MMNFRVLRNMSIENIIKCIKTCFRYVKTCIKSVNVIQIDRCCSDFDNIYLDWQIATQAEFGLESRVGVKFD